MKQFIGQELECDFNLNQNSDDKIQLMTKGKKYKIIDILGNSFIIKNDLDRFDIVNFTYFKVLNI